MASIANHLPIATSRTDQHRRRVFRVSDIPLEWSKETVTKKLQQLFPGHEVRVDSVYKSCYPTVPSNTAIITFNSGVPESLSSLNAGIEADITLYIGTCSVIFAQFIGMTTLFESSEAQPPQVDVIFVHGFNGHAIESWTAPNGKCWPRDFLGNDLAQARILSYGYEAKLHKDTSTSRLSDFGLGLIGEFLTIRPTTEAQRRPLFLIGHSFGGTIIASVMHELTLRRDKIEYKDILNAIECATFFGTPHQGMDVDLLKPLTINRSDSSMMENLNDIRHGSQILNTLHSALHSTSRDIRVITCVEQKLTFATSINDQERKQYYAVTMREARTYCQFEDIIPIQADHKAMIKFSYTGDTHYQKIVHYLSDALDNCRRTRAVRVLTKEEKQSLMYSLEYTRIEEHVKTDHVCDWVFKTPEYISWSIPSKVEKEDLSKFFLWIKGKAGSGKSTLMKFVLNHYQSTTNNNLILFHVFNARGSDLQKTITGMYRSLVLQVLKQTENVSRNIAAVNAWKERGNLQWKTPKLKELLEYLIPRLCRHTVCFIDALDESQDSDIQDVITFFEKLVRLSAENQSVLRICFSSRQYPNVSNRKGRCLVLQDQAGHNQNILRYVNSKLQVKAGESTQETYQELWTKASGVFMWAELAVKMFNKEFDRGGIYLAQKCLKELPADLHEIYRQILTQEGEIAKRDKLLLCLQAILEARKPLTATELYLLVLSDTYPKDLGKMSERTKKQPTELVALNYILDVSRGLAKETLGDVPTVQLIHESVADFLRKDNSMTYFWSSSNSSPQGKSHDRLKSCCLNIIEAATTVGTVNAKEIKEREMSLLSSTQNRTESYISALPALPVLSTVTSSRSKNDYCKDEAGRAIQPYRLESRLHSSDILRDSANFIQPDGSISDVAPGRARIQPTLCRKSCPASLSDPLLNIRQYAVENIFYHSNEAQKNGIPQDQFLQNFPLPHWIEHARTHEKLEELTPKANLLYVLAERDCPELIKALPNRLSYLEPQEELFGTPFFVALAKSNFSTIRTFFQIELENPSSHTSFLDKRLKPDKYNEMCDSYIDSVIRQNDFIQRTCRPKDCVLSDYQAVTSFMMQPGNEILQLFLLLTGRTTLEGANQERSLLEWSAQTGCVKFVQFFYEEGRLDLDSEVGFDILLISSEKGHISVVDLLIRMGSTGVDRRDDCGQTPLSKAASSGHTQVVRILLETGKANIESRDIDGRTPLARAAIGGNQDVVELLLQDGHAHVNSRDIYGKTPLDHALQGKHHNLHTHDYDKASAYDSIIQLLRKMEAHNTSPFSYKTPEGFTRTKYAKKSSPSAHLHHPRSDELHDSDSSQSSDDTDDTDSSLEGGGPHDKNLADRGFSTRACSGEDSHDGEHADLVSGDNSSDDSDSDDHGSDGLSDGPSRNDDGNFQHHDDNFQDDNDDSSQDDDDEGYDSEADDDDEDEYKL